MANDFNVNEFKLKDPVRSVPDGLQDPVKDKTPGFFQSIRNPLDLMLEESLPASLYQWMTGNTKKKQAQEALDYIRNNPQDKGSKIYQEAERKLQRFGYLLEDGPMHIDFKEVKSGTECGIGVLNYTDVQPGDQIEVFERIERARSL